MHKRLLTIISVAAMTFGPMLAQGNMPVIDFGDNIAATEPGHYVVRRGDTVYSIARKHGLTTEQLLEMNPGISPNNLVLGTNLLVAQQPQTPEPVPMNTPEPTSETAPEPTYQPEPETRNPLIPVIRNTDGDDGIEYDENQKLLVILPLNATAESRTRQSQLSTDFFRGLLIALQENGGNSRFPLEVVTIDTGAGTGALSEELDHLRNSGITMIVPPEDEDQFSLVADFAKRNDILLLNVFNLRDESYLTSTDIIQCNIPQNIMYEKALYALETDFDGYTPVILSPADGRTEKDSFVNALKAKYAAAGKDVIDLEYDERLSQENLATLAPERKYVFIPRSGSQAVFSTFAQPLVQFVDRATNREDYKVFGYPDWIAFRGDNASTLHTLGATYYSRMFSDPGDSNITLVDSKFREWFNAQPINTVPNQALLGYDIGNMLLRILKNRTLDEFADDNSNSTHYEGTQSAFMFRRAAQGGGLVNSSLYIITCEPNGRYSVNIL